MLTFFGWNIPIRDFAMLVHWCALDSEKKIAMLVHRCALASENHAYSMPVCEFLLQSKVIDPSCSGSGIVSRMNETADQVQMQIIRVFVHVSRGIRAVRQ